MRATAPVGDFELSGTFGWSFRDDSTLAVLRAARPARVQGVGAMPALVVLSFS